MQTLTGMVDVNKRKVKVDQFSARASRYKRSYEINEDATGVIKMSNISSTVKEPSRCVGKGSVTRASVLCDDHRETFGRLLGPSG